MPAWLPLLKASLPYVTQIVATALPAFTAKPAEEKTDDLTAQQIAELQSAATNNAESIHVLAEKLQQTIEGIELAGNDLQKKLIFFQRLSYGALAVAAVSLVIAIVSLLT
ncbi:MAG: hypothetical protein WA987_09970 [Cellvibrio sp.]|jgi:hypothetical protein